MQSFVTVCKLNIGVSRLMIVNWVSKHYSVALLFSDVQSKQLTLIGVWFPGDVSTFSSREADT
jgi:hypothetical protein